MPTTLRIDNNLYREAKAEAAREGMTLTCFIHEALALRLQKGKAAHAGTPVRIRTYRAGEPFPFDDRQLKQIAAQEEESHDIAKLKATGR